MCLLLPFFSLYNDYVNLLIQYNKDDSMTQVKPNPKDIAGDSNLFVDYLTTLDTLDISDSHVRSLSFWLTHNKKYSKYLDH